MISLAKHAACVVNLPKSPGHHFVEVTVGLLIMNSSVALSKVAVVSNAATSEPCPSSVWQ